jgi:hypothetical protein
MSSYTAAEAKSIEAAVETLGVEAEILLEHMPPGEVLAALCMAAAHLARKHRVGPAALTRIYGQVLANALRMPLVVSVQRLADLDDDTETDE